MILSWTNCKIGFTVVAASDVRPKPETVACIEAKVWLICDNLGRITGEIVGTLEAMRGTWISAMSWLRFEGLNSGCSMAEYT